MYIYTYIEINISYFFLVFMKTVLLNIIQSENIQYTQFIDLNLFLIQIVLEVF
jgi:hypothetical protein